MEEGEGRRKREMEGGREVEGSLQRHSQSWPFK